LLLGGVVVLVLVFFFVVVCFLFGVEASLGFVPPALGVASPVGDFVTVRWCGLDAELGSLGCVSWAPVDGAV
jgi:hypothetical protein